MLNPPGSGGLLAALHLWRKFEIGGPSHYGEMVYIGTVPLVGHDGLVDVVHGITGGVDCDFMFDPNDGTLLALEMFPNGEADPCEVYFSDYREADGRFLPYRMEVRNGDNLFGVFTVAKYDLQKGGIEMSRSMFPKPKVSDLSAEFALLAVAKWSRSWRSWSEPACRARTASAGPSLSHVIAQVQPKIVKIFGAGGLRGLESYQSGFLISADGYVLTVWSHVLDSDETTVILNDGRKYQGKLVGADPRLELALLKIDAQDLSFFDLSASVPAAEGTRVLADSNLFGVATGDESASVLHGNISAVTTHSTPVAAPMKRPIKARSTPWTR